MIDKHTEDHYLSVGILKKWHEKTFDQFTNDPTALEKVQKYLANYAHYKNEGIGMFLYGANGTGKTHLLNCVFKYLLHKRQRVQIVSFSSLVSKFISGWGDPTVIQEMKTVTFLGIEEVAKEFTSEKSKEIVRTMFDDVLRYRVQMQKPTWFTSNKLPDDMATLYTKDIASMLRECSITLQVKGSDFREKIFDSHNKNFK